MASGKIVDMGGQQVGQTTPSQVEILSNYRMTLESKTKERLAMIDELIGILKSNKDAEKALSLMAQLQQQGNQ